MTYGQAFVSTTILVHTLLYFRKHIVTQWTTNNYSDIHSRLMSRYHRVPGWWFVTIFCASQLFSWNHSQISIQWSCLLWVLLLSKVGQLNSLFNGLSLLSLLHPFMSFLSGCFGALLGSTISYEFSQRVNY